jgi:hypothetical protein
MIVEPRCEGPCVVELAYDGGMEMKFFRVLSRLCLAGGAGAAVVSRRGRLL